MWVCILAMPFTHLEESFLFLSLSHFNCEKGLCGLGMVVHTDNPSSIQEAEAVDYEFKGSLNYQEQPLQGGGSTHL